MIRPDRNQSERWFFWDGQDKQSISSLYIAVTVALWGTTTLLAILLPSLSFVLDLVGCATGTIIAFVLPALFWFKLRGYSSIAVLILVVGGAVGLVGTYFSLRDLAHDALLLL